MLGGMRGGGMVGGIVRLYDICIECSLSEPGHSRRECLTFAWQCSMLLCSGHLIAPQPISKHW
jgi:hypothetical protein